MSHEDYFSQFKEKVANNLGVIEPQTPAILIFNLSSSISGVFDICKKEIEQKIHPKYFKNERLLKLSEMLWYIASLEVLYNLPNSRYSNYINMGFELDNTEINLLETHGEALNLAAEISMAMAHGEIDEIQYNLNKLFAIVFDICIIYNINIVDCLNIEKDMPVVNTPEEEDSDKYKKAYRATKTNIKKDGRKEVIFTLKASKTGKYIAVIIKENNKVTNTFNFGDIILDFYEASNFIASNFKNEMYQINYDPAFRELLDNTNELVSGYIIGEDLIPASNLRKKLNLPEGSLIQMKEVGRPILMTPKMKTLNNLLDYMHVVKNIKNKA